MSSESVRVSVALPALAEGISEALRAVAGKDIAFVLMVSADNVTQYVSNTERKDGVELIEGLLARWKAGRADIPAHYNPDLKAG